MQNPKPNQNCTTHMFKLPKVEPFETNELHIGIVPSLTDHNHPANEIFRLISLMKAMIVAWTDCMPAIGKPFGWKTVCGMGPTNHMHDKKHSFAWMNAISCHASLVSTVVCKKANHREQGQQTPCIDFQEIILILWSTQIIVTELGRFPRTL